MNTTAQEASRSLTTNEPVAKDPVDPCDAPMSEERMVEIVSACVQNAMSRHIPGATWKKLPACSLEEMLRANRLILKRVPPYTGMVVDPRGLAAAYAFEQFGSDAESYLNAVGLTTVFDLDDDEDDGD